MRRVYTAAHLVDAQLLTYSLESNGIWARVFNESLQGGVGELPHVYPEVWIEDDNDWERARSLVEKFERGVTRNKGVVRCPQCYEENPGTFEICWQCGTAIAPLNETHGRDETKEKDQ